MRGWELIMLRRVFTVSLVFLTLLSACTRPDKTNEKSTVNAGQPVGGDSVVVRLEADPDNLNPLISTVLVGHYAMWGVNNSQIYELLMAYNTKDWGLTEPLLAEAPPIVTDVRVFDVYRGKDLPKGRKSLAFMVLLQDTRKTLTDAEVESAVSRLRETLQKRFDAKLR